ncbi:rhomboid family intramembrane serine protease [Hymenobacter nivis]|uniref:Rhomboid family intramembrane serine protease n=1 Tax=Hymenobacter nivis TaxID=1850093 RepID=A0A502HGB6_9BACT|nr:rhomboid family intramembrane serine protease [Hymenobacter nivis]TPG72220.1 rhomboid family intramembrane serine protease [Hymenobacter nivis]
MFNLTPTVRNLLIANVLLLVITLNLSQIPVVEYGALFPVGSVFFQPWQFVTYMFLHGGWGHLIGNMFGLISFGPLLEQRWGGPRFLFFWLICGFGSGLLYEGVRAYELRPLTELRRDLVQNPTGGDFAELVRTARGSGAYAADEMALADALVRSPNDPTLRATVVQQTQQLYQSVLASPMLGASGALFGVLFAFAYLFPNTELMLLFFPFPIKAKYFVFFYAIYELYNGVHRTPGDNVAHFAHLGGLLIGFLVLKYWERGRAEFY